MLIPRSNTDEFLAAILEEIKGLRADITKMSSVNVPTVFMGEPVEVEMVTTVASGTVELQEPAVHMKPAPKTKKVKK